MHYVYLLRSKVDGRTYVGQTCDLRRRLAEHNSGENFSTAYRRPFELIYYEAFRDALDARERESALKHHAAAMMHLKRRVGRSFEVF